MAKKKIFQISDALTEGLEETINAAHKYTGELRVEVIPIRKIETDPENPRDFMLNMEDLYQTISTSDPQQERKLQELESLKSIANSIREQGIINPIIVYKYGEKYRLVAGERRTLASILAGKTEIQAKILEKKPSELKISLLQWVENIERTDLSLWERLRNLEKIVSTYATQKGMHFKQVTITELSNLIGCTKPHAMNYKAVLDAEEDVKQLIKDNKIKNLEKAALIADIDIPEAKQNVINACLAGMPLKKLRVIAQQEKEKSSRSQIVKQQTKRGRQAVSINLGATKNINVAKAILDSVLKNQTLMHISSYFSEVNWNDYQAINDTFKQLLKKLEELHA